MSLVDFLTSFLGGSIVLGPVVFAFFEYTTLLRDVHYKVKPLIVAIVSAAVGIALWGLAAYLGIVPMDTKEVIAEAVWQYGIMTGVSAFMSSTVIHGATKLNKSGVG